MNVGILYPRSKAHPIITQDFLDGIKACTGLQQPGITFTSEAIGYGGLEKEVYEKAEKLLLIDEVDVLVAFIGEKVIEILHPLFQSSGKLLLVVHPGANYPNTWAPQPNIIQLTLQDAFLCWLCGQDAGKENAGDAVVASTFYDCGYLHLATMVNGFTSAGGKIVFNYINNQGQSETFHINELESFLREWAGPQKVLALFDELPAAQFYSKINEANNAAELNVFVSPMMLQPAALVNLPGGFKFSISGYTPWRAGYDAGNKDFYDAFRLKTKRDPGLFAMLGWETGMILCGISRLAVSTGGVSGDTAAALQKMLFIGPRGELRLDPHTNYFTAPFLKCSSSKDTGQVKIETQAFPNDAWKTYIQLPTDGAGSGWTNTYLCY